MPRRINLFAGPGAGKSTVATFLFHKMKCAGYNVEYAPEYVKQWTYYNRAPKSFDQVYLFARQLHNEDTILTGGFDYVICDSPLLLAYYYTVRSKGVYTPQLWEIARIFENTYPSLNIFIRRGADSYQAVGRFQTESESLEIDRELETLLPDMRIFQNDQGEEIYNHVIRSITPKEE